MTPEFLKFIQENFGGAEVDQLHSSLLRGDLPEATKIYRENLEHWLRSSLAVGVPYKEYRFILHMCIEEALQSGDTDIFRRLDYAFKKPASLNKDEGFILCYWSTPLGGEGSPSLRDFTVKALTDFLGYIFDRQPYSVKAVEALCYRKLKLSKGSRRFRVNQVTDRKVAVLLHERDGKTWLVPKPAKL
jgi:hypothetical protein